MKVAAKISSIVVASMFLGFVPAAWAEWNTYQGNASHDGYVPGRLHASALSLVWSTKLPSGSLTDMAVGGGAVFITDQPRVYALDEATGAVRWEKNYGVSTNPPAYSNGIVYVQTGYRIPPPPPAYLHAINASTGESVFDATFGAQFEHYLSPTPYEGSIYIDGGTYGGMYSFNATTGVQNFFTTLPQFDRWTPAVDNLHEYAYFPAALYVLDRSGAVVSRIYDPDPNSSGGVPTVTSIPVLGGRGDVVTIAANRILRFDLASQQVGLVLKDRFTYQPSVARGVIYAIDGGGLTAWDEGSGAALWGWSPPVGSLTGKIILTDNVAFVGSATATYAVDLLTHDIDWSCLMGGNLALSDNTLFIAASDGTLAAYTVPEPATLSLLALGGLALLRRRRK